MGPTLTNLEFSFQVRFCAWKRRRKSVDLNVPLVFKELLKKHLLVLRKFFNCFNVVSRFNQNLNTPKKVCRQKEKGKDTNNYQSGKLNIEQHEPYHYRG